MVNKGIHWLIFIKLVHKINASISQFILFFNSIFTLIEHLSKLSIFSMMQIKKLKFFCYRKEVKYSYSKLIYQNVQKISCDLCHKASLLSLLLFDCCRYELRFSKIRLRAIQTKLSAYEKIMLDSNGNRSKII